MNSGPVTIAVCNQKGGVGKTTTVYHLARAGAIAGMRVLAIDMDPQFHLTASLYAEDLESVPDGAADMKEALSHRGKLTLREILLETIWSKVTLAPTFDQTLTYVGQELLVRSGEEKRLRHLLREPDHTGNPVSEGYDLILIDCPPSLDILMTNAVAAADLALVVTEPDWFATRGIRLMHNLITSTRNYHNPGLKLAGFAINLYETRNSAQRAYGNNLLDFAEAKNLNIFTPAIPRWTIIKDSRNRGMGLDETGGGGDRRRAAAAQAIYSGLLHDVLAVNAGQPVHDLRAQLRQAGATEQTRDALVAEIMSAVADQDLEG
jgi:chromosome partitioning protein